MHPPSLEYLFGTTQQGRDVFSQVVYGTRSALIVGFLSAFCIVFIGTNVGLLAGYYGGWVDTVLMRITDVFYGIPFLPFALVLVSIFRPSLMLVIAVIGFLMWRTTARVIRSQVLTLRERKFIQAARASGSSHFRILYLHIAPNILPMCFLYMAFGVSWGVLGEASLSFLGLGDPDIVSWGGILYDAFNSGGMRKAWWWTIPPGLCITLFVVGCFMIGRAYEEVINPRLQRE
jgi:peptide/nickel transport system permease protein